MPRFWKMYNGYSEALLQSLFEQTDGVFVLVQGSRPLLSDRWDRISCIIDQ